VYPTVASHTKRALEDDIFSLNHRGSQFEKLYESVTTQLKQLLTIPEEYSIFFLSSGTEAMERIVQNTVEKNSFHIVTGTFGDRFYKTAQELGKNAVAHVFDPLKVFSAKDISVPKDAQMIAFTHNDTSTGMQIPASEMYAIAEQNPEALIAIDAVSSMPYMDVDYSKVDCVFFSVQKGFGMPAGLGILIVSPRAIARSKHLQANGISTGSYHSFDSLLKYAEKNQTPDTPNVFGIYLLSKVLIDFHGIGIRNIRNQTEQKAQMLYDYFESSATFTPLVKDTDHRSRTTLVIEVAGGSSGLIKYLHKNGYIVGSGYGEHKNDHIRIANFPAHTIANIEGLIELLKSV
jgi:phosphoserine aminotransferase